MHHIFFLNTSHLSSQVYPTEPLSFPSVHLVLGDSLGPITNLQPLPSTDQSLDVILALPTLGKVILKIWKINCPSVPLGMGTDVQLR